jgi:protein gp37
MYPWVTNMHTHLEGECPHKCKYCYVSGPGGDKRPEKYCGPLRLNEDEFKVSYGSGKTIFIEHCNDLFCDDVPDVWIERILAHCQVWPDNTYVFQTKNPRRYLPFIRKGAFPPRCMLGVTVETNRDMTGISDAPAPEARFEAMDEVPGTYKRFVTIEPILKFDLDEFVWWLGQIEPDFINIGADSKDHGLEEPTIEEVEALAAAIEKLDLGIEVLEKHNMERLRRASV